MSNSSVWDFVGAGSILGVPFSFVLLIVTAIVAHFVLTRLAHRLAHHGGRRIASRRLQCRHFRAAHRVPHLRRLRNPLRARRDPVCGAAVRRRPGHRHWSRAHGGHRGADRRQQRRRRPRFDRQGADGGDHRLPARERAGPARLAERGVVDGRRARPADRDRHRCALGEMATQSPRQGLRVSGLSRAADGSALCVRPRLRPMR